MKKSAGGFKPHIKPLKAFAFTRIKKKLIVRDLIRNPVLGDFSMIYLYLPANTSLPNICHKRTVEVIYCLKGTMTAVLAGKPSRARPNSLIFIPKGVWHKFTTGAQACEALALFHPELVINRWADIHAEPGINMWD